ncbi:class F sortase [Streptomyces sp. TLI_171]|uniref:class F sortase n=1 Tax=Streptomyces sp. TLI_171 TaxID=1938859 RepID=UPI000C1883B9|nr:class F sortase [Streptomyces sp. TLI_171]RKE23646.1 sortase family protein [Streptomyces sp. TLI_171]
MNPPERAGRPLPASGRPAVVRTRLAAALTTCFARARAAATRSGAGAARTGAALRAAGPHRLAGAGAVAAGLALAGLGASAVADRPASPAPARVADVGELPATVHGAAPAAAPTSPTVPGTGAARPPVAPPVRLRIPRIGLDSALGELQVQDDGHLAAPADPDVAGWWSQGPAPGGPGTAVIVGHVDSRTGPAVFAGLSVLRPGDAIEVQAADGTVSSFTVQALRSYDKQAFPDEQVFGDTAGPSLRLITCGGSYDRAQRSYDANLVVFAAPPAHGNDTPTA